MNKIQTSIIILIISFSTAIAQSEFPKVENQLKNYFREMYASESDKSIDSLNQLILEVFSSTLQNPKSFNYKWDSLNMVGQIHTADLKLNIYTWFVKSTKGKYSYFGYIQYNRGSKKKPEIDFYPLINKSRGMKNPEMSSLTPENWLGCVYYKDYVFNYKRQDYYTLLGYDFNNDFSSKKIIEVLVIDKDGKPSFGGDFKLELQNVKRMILEYSAQLVISIKFDDKLQMIVLDHLAPFEPMFTGNYRFYGPDGSYDGLKFQKGSFLLQKDVDARNLQ